MAKAFGLDVGSRSVKLVELEGSARKFRVTRYLSKDVGEVGGVAETVGAVLKEGGVRRDGLITALDSKNVMIREILVPFLQEDQIRRVLRFEAEAHLHNCAIEDVVVDCVKIGEVKDQSKILIFAAPKDRIREALQLIQMHGVDPMHIDLDLAALFNASQAVGAFEEHPNSLVLHIGATTTFILSVQDGELRSCRSVRTGSESITRVISADLAVDTDSARVRVAEGDGSPREDDLLAPIPLDDEEETAETAQSATQLENAIVEQRQDDFLTRLYRETTRSLATTTVSASFDAIYLTGAASLSGGVRRRLEDRFRKPVIRLEFIGENDRAVSAVNHDQANASMGIALGCALKYLGHEGVDVEFRRDELRYTRKFDLIKVALASTVSLVFILLFLTWLHYQNTLRVRRTEYGQVLQLLDRKYVTDTRKRYKEVLEDKAERLPAESPDQLKKVPSWNSQIQRMHRHITDKMGFKAKGIPEVRSALGVWKDVFDRLESRRDELGYLLLREVKINQKSVSFDGLIGNPGDVDLIALELKKLDYVVKVGRDPTEVDKQTQKFKFGIQADLAPTKPE